jgi:MFS family permease
VIFAVMPIITAAAMDQVDKGSEGTATALMFSGGAMIGALAPLIAGIIYASSGFHGVVIFAGSAAALGAVAAVVLRAAPKKA